MKKVLVIGSTCVDMILKVDQLPSTAASMNIYGQDASVGGCAYNVYDTLRNFGIPSVLFTPVGTGIYGDFIRYHLGKKGHLRPHPAGTAGQRMLLLLCGEKRGAHLYLLSRCGIFF